MTPNISEETFELAKIYSLCANANLRSQVITNSKSVMGQAKHFIKTSVTNRLNAIENDLKGLFGDNPQHLEMVKEDMISAEVALQNENIMNMFLALPKGIRDEIEMYIEQRYYIYKNK